MQQNTIDINTATPEEVLSFLQSTLYSIKGLNVGLSINELSTIFDKARSGLVKPEEKTMVVKPEFREALTGALMDATQVNKEEAQK